MVQTCDTIIKYYLLTYCKSSILQLVSVTQHVSLSLICTSVMFRGGLDLAVPFTDRTRADMI